MLSKQGQYQGNTGFLIEFSKYVLIIIFQNNIMASAN